MRVDANNARTNFNTSIYPSYSKVNNDASYGNSNKFSNDYGTSSFEEVSGSSWQDFNGGPQNNLKDMIAKLAEILELFCKLANMGQPDSENAENQSSAPSSHGKDGFENCPKGIDYTPSQSGTTYLGSEQPAKTSSVNPSSSTEASGSKPVDIARSVSGQNIADLKNSGPLAQYLEKWPGNDVCCANFVSACLEKAGQIDHSEHNDSVSGLATNLEKDSKWSKTTLENAKPGDVVCFSNPEHVVMFAGFKDGKAQFIGSNNANADGTQKITETPMDYPISGVYHYNG